jgi:hypothetical protein
MAGMDFLRLMAELDRTKIEIVFTDLKVALEFADLAATSENAERRNRNRAHARKAYLDIRDKLLPLCNPTTLERAEIVEKLVELRHCLERLGEKIA